jgi:hypothetical protein
VAASRVQFDYRVSPYHHRIADTVQCAAFPQTRTITGVWRLQLFGVRRCGHGPLAEDACLSSVIFYCGGLAELPQNSTSRDKKVAAFYLASLNAGANQSVAVSYSDPMRHQEDIHL